MPSARGVAAPVLRSRTNGTDILGIAAGDEPGDDGWSPGTLVVVADGSTEAAVSLAPRVGVHPASATTRAKAKRLR
jgi:hypothetical protein